MTGGELSPIFCYCVLLLFFKIKNHLPTHQTKDSSTIMMVRSQTKAGAAVVFLNKKPELAISQGHLPTPQTKDSSTIMMTRSQTKAEAEIEDHAPVSSDEDGSSDDEEQAWCFRCHKNFSMEHSGGDWGENEEWVCNHCLPACLKCHATLFSTRQECCGEGRSDDCKN